MKKQNSYYYLTAKKREALSYPAKIVMNRELLSGEILDYGCGYGKDVELLKERGFSIEGYDKYYAPDFPTKKYDTILCFYVLNVLLPEEQAQVLMELSQLIKPTGKVYIAVRRDVKYEGYRMHKLYQQQTYQCNVVLKSKSIFQNDSCEIYEYQHYNQLNREEGTDCPFCQPSSETELLVESGTAYAIFDKFPVNEGHALIIPKRHCER